MLNLASIESINKFETFFPKFGLFHITTFNLFRQRDLILQI